MKPVELKPNFPTYLFVREEIDGKHRYFVTGETVAECLSPDVTAGMIGRYALIQEIKATTVVNTSVEVQYEREGEGVFPRIDAALRRHLKKPRNAKR